MCVQSWMDREWDERTKGHVRDVGEKKHRGHQNRANGE
jgi:hypothetical protein